MLLLEIDGEEHQLVFTKEKYRNNYNLAISALHFNQEYGCWTRWCMVTINLDKKLPYNQSYLDTENCSKEIIEYLYKNKCVKEIELQITKSNKAYPLVVFSDSFMNSLKEYI